MLIPLGDFVPAWGVYSTDVWKLSGIFIDLLRVVDITMNANRLYIEKDNGKEIRLELDLNFVNPKLGLPYLREVIENVNNRLVASAAR